MLQPSGILKSLAAQAGMSGTWPDFQEYVCLRPTNGCLSSSPTQCGLFHLILFHSSNDMYRRPTMCQFCARHISAHEAYLHDTYKPTLLFTTGILVGLFITLRGSQLQPLEVQSLGITKVPLSISSCSGGWQNHPLWRTMGAGCPARAKALPAALHYRVVFTCLSL